MYEEVWNACYNTSVENSIGVSMNLASNSVIVPAQVKPGATGLSMALVCQGVILGPKGELPAVTTPNSGITIKVTKAADFMYAMPGHSYIDKFQLLSVKVDVSKTAQPGLRDILVTNFGQSSGTPGAAFLRVVPEKTDGVMTRNR
jgi:hypothetical protein